jgi:glycosyltransferase involved in cell wall biosynthesis
MGPDIADNVRPRCILHVITDLYVGGAEITLSRVLAAKPGLADRSRVVSLLPSGFLAEELRAAGIPLVELNMRKPFGAVTGVLRLARLVAEWKPDIVQGWMYHGDLAALLALILSGRRRATRLAWNIRCSTLDFSRYSSLLRLVVRACAALSSFPDLVIANSQAGMDAHRTLGYRPRRAEIVPNGIDMEKFKPNPTCRMAVRRELGIPEEAIVLAHVARLDPMKDHAGFLQAMTQLSDLHALLVGAGTDSLTAPPNVHRLGRRSDIPRLLAAADFIVSSSAFGEGFSNALAEGMACGLPPIATDVGDAVIIVGDSGLVIPPRDVAALTDAIRAMVQETHQQRAARGIAARAHIAGHFSLELAHERFKQVYTDLLQA